MIWLMRLVEGGEMKNDFFCFTKQTPVVIYGCNKSGINYYHWLRETGYTVPCFIDNRAIEFNYACILAGEKIPVCRLEEYEARDVKPIILIAIRNSVEQTNVARILLEKSFQQVVFLPMIEENSQNSHAITCMRSFYRDFSMGKIREDAMLPTQRLLWGENSFWDHAVIQENESSLLVWMPISLIHFYSLRQAEKMSFAYGFQMVNETSADYYDESVFQLKWLNDLVEFLLEGKGSLEEYWRVENEAPNYIKKKSSKENQLWIADRQKCIEILMSGMNRESGALTQSAVPVQWNEKGYFNICDGSHRLVFLNFLNMQMAPVQLSRQDYAKWINMEALQRLLAYIKEKQVTAFEAPIPHPWFYGCEVREEKCGRTILKCIFEKLKQLGMERDFSVLDVNPQEGYYLQHFARINAGVLVGVLEDQKQRELMEYLNQLFYMDGKIQIMDSCAVKRDDMLYDIVLMFKKLCSLSEEEQVPYIGWIASKAQKMIVWESGINYERERELILQYSGFTKYIFLKRTLSENIIREVGIFVKR